MRTIVNGALEQYFKYEFYLVEDGMVVRVPVATLDDDDICRETYDIDIAVKYDILNATEDEKEEAFVAAVALEAGPWR